jgi:hypothetical protein
VDTWYSIALNNQNKWYIRPNGPRGSSFAVKFHDEGQAAVSKELITVTPKVREVTTQVDTSGSTLVKATPKDARVSWTFEDSYSGVPQLYVFEFGAISSDYRNVAFDFNKTWEFEIGPKDVMNIIQPLTLKYASNSAGYVRFIATAVVELLKGISSYKVELGFRIQATSEWATFDFGLGVAGYVQSLELASLPPPPNEEGSCGEESCDSSLEIQFVNKEEIQEFGNSTV